MSNPTLTLTLKDGDVVIEMLPDVAPKHVEQITKIVNDGSYDGVAFHRDYRLDNDFDESVNLLKTHPSIAAQLRNELENAQSLGRTPP